MNYVLITALLTLSAFSVVLLLGVLWVLTKVRADQLIIRVFIAKELAKRQQDNALPGPSQRSANLAAWLANNPDRPHRDDPPINPHPRAHHER